MNVYTSERDKSICKTCLGQFYISFGFSSYNHMRSNKLDKYACALHHQVYKSIGEIFLYFSKVKTVLQLHEQFVGAFLCITLA